MAKVAMPAKDDMESMYGEEEGSMEHEGMEHKEGEHESVDEEEAEDMGHTAVVDTKVLMKPGGPMPKEGDEIVVKVGKVFGDEAVISYAPEKPGGDEYGGKGEDMDGAMKELDEMNEKG